MKKYLILLGSLIASHVGAQINPQAAIETKLAAEYLLTDITKTDDKLLAVGKWGNIVYSKDYEHWQQANSPVQSLLTSVFFINDELGWAVGHDATILHSKDGGVNWHIQQFLPELDKPLLDIVFFDEKHGLAVGAYGMSYRTRNGGVTWQKEFYDSLLYLEDKQYLEELKRSDPDEYAIETEAILPHFNKLYRDGDSLWLVGELGLMAKSYDLGQTWQRQAEIYPGSFFTFNKFNHQYIVAGLRGTAFVSNDGDSWQKINTQTTASINDIKIVNDRALFLANGGVWLTYSKYGLTKMTNKDGKSLLAGVVSDEVIVIASEAGIQEISVQ